MFSKLKGYLRRLSTPKKETNYQPKETSYGDIKVSYVGSVKVNNSLIHDSSIILQISYERNMQDADKDRNFEIIGLVTTLSKQCEQFDPNSFERIFEGKTKCGRENCKNCIYYAEIPLNRDSVKTGEP